MSAPGRPSRRQVQAADTRRQILDSAQRLFTKEGYLDTTIARIADDAGVAVQTVYKAFGTKDAIVGALFDRFDAEAKRLSSLVSLSEATSPPEEAGQLAAFYRALFDVGRETLEAIRGFGSVGGHLAAMVDEGSRRRRAFQSGIVRRWHRARHLLPNLTEGRAADLLWTLTSPELYILLVVQSGWPSPEYEEWLRSVVVTQLLRPVDGATEPPQQPRRRRS